MVIIQWSTRETVPTIGHRHLCHRVLYFRTFYMFSSTSIFKTRSPETTVRSDISNPPRVWPRDYMQLELRQGHPPNGQSDWCHLWFPMLESAEPKKRRNMFSNGALLEVWTIAYFHWSVTRTHIYIYTDSTYMLIENVVLILVVSVRACPGAMPLGLDQEKEYAPFFLHVGN